MVWLVGQYLIMWTLWTALDGAVSFLENWQTIIAGGIAIIAARMTVKPVWKQLALMQTQSNAVLRDMLMDRQTEVEQAMASLKEHVSKPAQKFAVFFNWMNEGDRISEEDAHGHFHIFAVCLRWLRIQYRWRDSAAVEIAKASLEEKLDKLTDLLNEITAPLTTDQHDEERSISDEDWAAFVARGEEAKGEVEEANFEVITAANNMIQVMGGEIDMIKNRLKKIDTILIEN